MRFVDRQREWIDALHDRLSWLPVFVPVFYPGVAVSAGDVINIKCARHANADSLMPDYELSGVLTRERGEPVHFRHRLPYVTREFRQHSFYQDLFAGMEGLAADGPVDGSYGFAQPEVVALGVVPTLRRYVQERLPDYMVPASFVVLSTLPRLRSGKVDRRALPRPGGGHGEGAMPWEAPQSEVERVVADVWRNVLDIDQVGLHDNFFDLGGDSLLISSARSRLESVLETEISIVDLFRYPTVHSFARFVEDGEPRADLFAGVQDRARKRLTAAGQMQHLDGAGGI